MAVLRNIQEKKTGVLTYLLLLLLAIIVLFYIAYTSFKQSKALRESTELVSNTQNIINEINMHFANYSGLESAGIKYLISNDSLNLGPVNDFNDRGTKSLTLLRELLAGNKDQLKQLDRLPGFSDQLYSEMLALDEKTAQIIFQSDAFRDRLLRIEGHLDSLEAIQKTMIATELAFLKQRREEYESNVTLTPTNILYSTLFALGILMFAFSKINSDRKKIAATRGFLQNVLENTSNIIHYYEPVFNDSGAIVDFKIIYNNVTDSTEIGATSKTIVGKNLSKVYNHVEEQGIVEFLASAIEKKQSIRREINFEIHGEENWFDSIATVLGDGVSTTTRNTTHERLAKRQLQDLNRQLEIQNLELTRTSAFLNNILSTVQSVISYLEAVRNDKGEIVDFKIVFSNQKITDLVRKTPDELKEKLVSKEYPHVLENGDFEKWVETVETGEPKEYEKDYELEGGYFYFCNEVAKLADGVTVVSLDITLRKQAESELQQINESLEVQNTILSDAEKVAGIGSYNWNLSTDIMEYSDNAYRLFGYEPGAFNPSLEKFMSFIHPKDRELVQHNKEETFKHNKRREDIYRIKTKDAKTKHIASMGHFIEKDGDRYLIGVIRDITEHVKNEKKLKAKNRELKHINAELESFNRVASHDLQEPLRKIQMFISRLTDTERKNLSDKGVQYLDKIESSANRMQSLIRNLLSYSRISDEMEKTHKVNLNKVIEKVQEDLAGKIEETNATIEIPDLPMIIGTEFQLEQLFGNLLSNSLKYKKDDQAPHIKITSEVLSRKKMDADLGLPANQYLLLSVSDNGIGFEQQHSEKIFKLFERLHGKHAYTGTGLGLAICEKIVKNHRGHISAHSELGKGTTIKIYLPFKN